MNIKAIVYKDETLLKKAEEISLKTGVPFLEEKIFLKEKYEKDSYLFTLSNKYYELKKIDSKEKGVFVNFFSKDIIRRIKTASYKNPLCKAIGLNSKTKDNLFILDATAGLGRDSFFLYSLGAKIAGFERNPFLFYLLEKAYENFIQNGEFFNNDPDRLSFFNIDSKIYLEKGIVFFETDIAEKLEGFLHDKSFNVVYLDPMYPPRKKKSAKPKKEMLYLKDIVGSDLDSSRLFESCLNKNIKIVVKRPVYADPVSGDLLPNYSIESKMVRYDVYV